MGASAEPVLCRGGQLVVHAAGQRSSVAGRAIAEVYTCARERINDAAAVVQRTFAAHAVHHAVHHAVLHK